ncbi:MAG: hypothetical protein ACI9T9_002761 [Oleiphilaceae bacterium]|jgi:hypothetical protein
MRKLSCSKLHNAIHKDMTRNGFQEHHLQELTPEEVNNVSGGFSFLGANMALAVSSVGYVTGPIMIMLGMLKLFHSLGWFETVQNANGPGSVIHNVTGGNAPSGSVNGGGFGSDIRLKQDIKVEGHIDHLDVTVYSWEYKNFPGERFVGVMAQDLLARTDLADSVFTFKEGVFEGFYGVDYAKLGLRCIPSEAFDGDVATLIVSNKVMAAA